MYSNINVDVVSTRGSLARSMNPYSAHALNNFTSNVDRQGNESSLFVEKTLGDRFAIGID